MSVLPSQTDMGRICRKGSPHSGLLAEPIVMEASYNQPCWDMCLAALTLWRSTQGWMGTEGNPLSANCSLPATPF